MDGYMNNPKPRTKTQKSLFRRKKLKREYDEWILGDQLYEKKKKSSITLGVVPGVVVEERRLKHMLYELARQRHEYNSKHIYNKKGFLDKQMNKSKSLRKALQHESLSRGWSVGERDVSFDDSSEGVSIEHGYVPKYNEKGILSRTRLGLMNKGDDKSNDGAFQWITLPPIDNSKPASRGTYIKTVKFDAVLPTSSSPRHSTHGSQPESRTQTFERYPSIYRERSKSLPTPSLIPWSAMKSTNIQPGTCLPPVTKDKRFIQLESILYPTYHGSRRLRSVQLSSMINNCDSLNIPAKGNKTSRKNMKKQIQQFLIQMGIV